MIAIENSLAFKTDQLTVSLGQTKLAPPILREVSLEILQARWTCIVGPNGAGKSTLLKTLAGLLPFSGDVQLLGCPLREWSNRDRGRTLSWLDQNGMSADGLRVFDVVMLGRIPHQPWLAPASEQDRLAVEQAVLSIFFFPSEQLMQLLFV
jgi:iron complex transport system ATP-binding protein